jgi:glycosyltransferase involved in cell wall biosynthesis
MNPKISVIIPCYNYGAYIENTVASVLAQTFKDFEIIIVNDGSTDKDTLEILKKIENEYPEIIVIHQKNGHLANARNNGIKASSGEFFLPLDSDDAIESRMLEECYEKILQERLLGFIYTYVRFFGDINFVWKSQEYNFYDLLYTNHPTVCGLVRKKAWEDVGGYDENMKSGYEDWEFWINLGEKGWYGKLIKKPLFKYRKHGKSMVLEARLKHDSIVEYIKNKHSELYSHASLVKIKKEWKSENKLVLVKKVIKKELSIIKLKLVLADLLNPDEWGKHPLRTLGRCIPIRIKKRVNSFLRRKFFDDSYFNRNI